ncbi:hypothetical protein [Cellulomonas sp. NS3]|uniref:hypothetical protein n=1 Tax=Cellulomonas sp. NS3 TaxID=2973977 RepID=UPI00216136C5|nr:hypothetical protein [Cellulomonas sp. NS3]
MPDLTATSNSDGADIKASTTSTSVPDAPAPLRLFTPTLRARISRFVPYASYTSTCAFLSGYAWGADREWLGNFRNWLVARGKGRPELGWPWLVLCELYPENALPSARNWRYDDEDDAAARRVLLEQLEDDAAARRVLFELLEEFFASEALDD